MIKIEPIPGPIHEFRLAERAARKSAPASLEGKVALTEPVVLELDAGLIGEDQQLQAEYKQLAKTHHHFFVSLTCSFAPQGDERFESAEIGVKLDNDHASPPVVHSMRPACLVDTATVKNTAKIGANFCFSPEVGVEQEVEKKELFLRTFLSGAKAHWLFQRTKASAIEGSYPLQFVVRAPKSYAAISGELDLSVRVGNKRFWIFWDKEDFSEQATVRFSGGRSHG